MKLRNKITIIIAGVLLFMLIIPLLVIRLSPNDMGLGFSFILFFAICPCLILSLGVISGTDMRKLFIVPIAVAFVFPFCYAIVVWKMIWELFLYSVLYCLAGVLSMISTHFYLKYKKEKKEDEQNEMSICEKM